VVSSCIYGGTPLTKNKERKKEKYMSSAREVLKNENASVTLLFAFYLALFFFSSRSQLPKGDNN
jgi:hypothetical protein